MGPDELVKMLKQVAGELEAETTRINQELATLCGLHDQGSGTAIAARIECRKRDLAKAEDFLLEFDDCIQQAEALTCNPQGPGYEPTTFLELVRVLDSNEMRKSAGRWAELMRLGGEKVRNEWGEYREYADSTVDRPILTPETVGGDADE